jgi:ribosome-binding factor A
MKRTRRSERVSGLLLEEVSRVVLRVVKDPRISGVTFTSVRVSPDLRFARVYFSVVGGPRKQEEALRGFQSAKGIIKRELGRTLELQYVPEIEFVFDDSMEYAQHIEELLQKIRDGKA